MCVSLLYGSMGNNGNDGEGARSIAFRCGELAEVLGDFPSYSEFVRMRSQHVLSRSTVTRTNNMEQRVEGNVVRLLRNHCVYS